MNGTKATSIVHASTATKIAAVSDALALPDVSGLEEMACAEPENLVTLVAYLESQLEAATQAFESACAPVLEAAANARAAVKEAIVKNGGKKLAHPTFDVTYERPTRREKRIDVLRKLEALLPADLYREAVRVKSLDVTHCRDPRAVEEAIINGAEPTWDANLVKLNKYARDYGGEIAKVIEEGSPKVEVGEAVLIIKPRESALRVVS